VTNIYVGNLSFQATEDDLREAFSEFGEITSVNIIMDRETGRSRGFAFVEMPDANEAKNAIEGTNQRTIQGRQISVNEARPRADRGGERRGGSRSGGGRKW